MVGDVWAAAPSSTHSALTRLRGTWTAILPAEVLQAVDLRAQQVKTAQALLQKQRAARAAVPAPLVPAPAPPAGAMPYPVAGMPLSAGPLFQGPPPAGAAAFPGLPPHAYGPPLLPSQYAPPPAAYGGAYGVAVPQPYPPGPGFPPAGGHFPPSGSLPVQPPPPQPQQPQQHAMQPPLHLQGAPGVGGVLSSLLGGLPSHLTSSGQPSSSHAARPATAAPPVLRPAARASTSSARENIATTHFEPVFVKARARAAAPLPCPALLAAAAAAAGQGRPPRALGTPLLHAARGVAATGQQPRGEAAAVHFWGRLRASAAASSGRLAAPWWRARRAR